MGKSATETGSELGVVLEVPLPAPPLKYVLYPLVRSQCVQGSGLSVRVSNLGWTSNARPGVAVGSSDGTNLVQKSLERLNSNLGLG